MENMGETKAETLGLNIVSWVCVAVLAIGISVLIIKAPAAMKCEKPKTEKIN